MADSCFKLILAVLIYAFVLHSSLSVFSSISYILLRCDQPCTLTFKSCYHCTTSNHSIYIFQLSENSPFFFFQPSLTQLLTVHEKLSALDVGCYMYVRICSQPLCGCISTLQLFITLPTFTCFVLLAFMSLNCPVSIIYSNMSGTCTVLSVGYGV